MSARLGKVTSMSGKASEASARPARFEMVFVRQVLQLMMPETEFSVRVQGHEMSG